MISVCGESPTVRELFHCGDAFATVVSVNRAGGTVDIPFTLEPDTATEKQRCAGSLSRRQERLEVCFILSMYNICCSCAIIMATATTKDFGLICCYFCFYHYTSVC